MSVARPYTEPHHGSRDLELFSISLTGYRRFKRLTTLRTNGKLIAILGPNEAGKSTLLKAIHHLGNPQPITAAETSRGIDAADVRIEGRFLLSEEDLKKACLRGPRWMIVQKRASGKRFYDFVPAPPSKNIAFRNEICGYALSLINNPEAAERIEESGAVEFEEIERALEGVGKCESEALPKELSATVKRITEQLESIEVLPITLVAEQLNNLLAREAEPTPLRIAIDALYQEVPEFMFFNESERDLAGSYQVEDLKSEVPDALANLSKVAGLDFAEVFQAIENEDRPKLSTIERRANVHLEAEFSKNWNQSSVRVNFRIDFEALDVQIIDEQQEFTSLGERSDGLRQFIALQAFAMNRRARCPILLIDEAEHRLHYDAQADLVQMLAKQSVAPKVIYTTHSAGCLPEDLGNGVRLARPLGPKSTESEIKNKFWDIDRGAGLSPLLFGMGASTLAFFPTRRAALVEGPVDMILYPTMFREALDIEAVDFQFVPGLSKREQMLAPLLARKHAGLAYLVDGDVGGSEIRDHLIRRGIPSSRIVVIKNGNGSALELEDFLDPPLLIEAANNLLGRFHAGSPQLTEACLVDPNRASALEASYLQASGVKLPKVELAYEILDILDESPGRRILDGRRIRGFRAIANLVRDTIELAET